MSEAPKAHVMADAANDVLRYPESFNEFLALMERWHRERHVTLQPGECVGSAMKRSADAIQSVTEVARQVWNNAEARRTAPTSAAGATKPNELTSSPEPAPALRAAEWVDEAMRLAERIEAAGARRGREGKAPSDHEPEMNALRAHLSRASGLLPVAREGLPEERIMLISEHHDTGRAGGDYSFARAIEAAHGIALPSPASGDAPGEAK